MSMGVLSQFILLLVEIVCFEKSPIFTRAVPLHAVKHHWPQLTQAKLGQ